MCRRVNMESSPVWDTFWLAELSYERVYIKSSPVWDSFCLAEFSYDLINKQLLCEKCPKPVTIQNMPPTVAEAVSHVTIILRVCYIWYIYSHGHECVGTCSCWTAAPTLAHVYNISPAVTCRAARRYAERVHCPARDNDVIQDAYWIRAVFSSHLDNQGRCGSVPAATSPLVLQA